MNKGLKNKGLGSWFCLAAALVALITGIVFLLTQATAAPLGHSGTMAGVVLLVGAAASLVFFFVSVPFSAMIQAVIYNIALYLVVVQLYFVFADVINHVTFAGGNAGLCVFYMVGTFIACLLSVIACFCKQTKTGEAKSHRQTVCCRRCGGRGRCGLRGRFLPAEQQPALGRQCGGCPRCGADFCRWSRYELQRQRVCFQDAG